MNVCLEQVVALNYATTRLEATHVIVTLATNLMQTTIRAKVSFIIFNVHTRLIVISDYLMNIAL